MHPTKLGSYIAEVDMPNLLGVTKSSIANWRRANLVEGVDYIVDRSERYPKLKWKVSAVERYRPGSVFKKAKVLRVPPNTKILMTDIGKVRCRDNRLFNVGMDIQVKPVENGEFQVIRNPRSKTKF